MLLSAERTTRAPGALRRGWRAFRTWTRGRPFIGGLLLMLSGGAIFLSTQMDLGNIRVQMGIEGFQAVLIPAGLALLGLLAIVTPAQHLFYGILALIVAVYSIIGVNLGGFFVGMLLGVIGGILVVAWLPLRGRAEARSTREGARAS
ncbi:MAG: hypothetical protein J7480_01600 [Microbacteriaceae bacterium]|nr:hypothetical protein [Microbacteriaceae bacterium]